MCKLAQNGNATASKDLVGLFRKQTRLFSSFATDHSSLLFLVARICPTFFSPAPLRAFLIGTAIRLETDLTHSQQTRKHFLIGTIRSTFASVPPLTHYFSLITHHCFTSFLVDTNKPHKIIILVSLPMKTKEKQFSIQYKFAVRGTCNLACASFSRTHELQRNDVASKRTARPSLPRRSAHNA